VLHFEADWAEECKQMNVVLAELAKQFTHTIFIRVCYIISYIMCVIIFSFVCFFIRNI